MFASCCLGEEQIYIDPTLKRCHSKKCMETEIAWLKRSRSGEMWMGTMPWDERIKELEEAIKCPCRI